MALVNSPKGELYLVEIGEVVGNTTVFTHNALINSTRNLNVTLDVEEDALVDLANMSLPAQKVRATKSIDFKIDGAGKVDATSTIYWLNWMQSGQPKTVRYRQVSNVVTNANAVGTAFVTGPFLCTSFTIEAETQKYASVSVTLQQSGLVTSTSAT